MESFHRLAKTQVNDWPLLQGGGHHKTVGLLGNRCVDKRHFDTAKTARRRSMMPTGHATSAALSSCPAVLYSVHIASPLMICSRDWLFMQPKRFGRILQPTLSLFHLQTSMLYAAPSSVMHVSVLNKLLLTWSRQPLKCQHLSLAAYNL